ncbi:type VI secretion system tip protein VgrG [Rhodospirillaceae bacterium SYSU D60014]|uniref:type VI secretion system Vgr family protein n=1 Tax=Virgifigura deserti TaxID=2268457 RepID=UPI000E671FDA
MAGSAQTVTLTQAGRWLSVETALGEDAFVLTGFEGDEQISGLFSYRLEMASSREAIAADDLLGKPVTFHVALPGGETRCFNGIINRFAAGPMWARGYRRYYAEVVPWLWFLTRTTDCRIFQEKTVPDIVKQIFGDLGFTDFEASGIKGKHPPRDYCVQYRESDFDFVSRLLEEEGIFYFFKHEVGKHTLVLADQRSAYVDCEDGEVEFRTGTGMLGRISSWRPSFEFRSGKVSQQDYNFETPGTSLATTTNTLLKTPKLDKFEIYDYPGRYAVKADGQALTEVRMEEQEAPYAVTSGESDCRSFSPGAKFTLVKHECRSEEGKTYVITGVRHAASDETHFAGQGGTPTYANSFTCIPEGVTYRAPGTTPRPVVRGPQTAVVVGPSGEEIYCDKYGRVKVQFHWDREGKKNEKSSCWMRVAQSWAGRKWGVLFTPRIGMEVLVDFLEGDPDRPIIVGCVYNADQMPPYVLPDNKTQSGIKTRSSKQGADANFNELRFEDKKGSEEVYFHAEKDFKRIVENDDSLEVGNDQTITVKNNRTEIIEEGNEKITIKKGNRTETIEKGNEELTIKTGNRTETIDGNEELTIKKGNRKETIEMGNDTLTIKMGNRAVKLNLGKDSLEAMQSIELKVGQNSIKIDQTGITLKGMMIKIEGQAMVEAKAPMTQVKGDGMLTLKGGVTMIN